MPRAQLQKKQIEDTEKRILSVTRQLITESGWSGAQISVIASRADLATGSVYRYFASKADLCVHVLAAVSRREADVVQSIFEGHGDATSRLRAAVSTFIRRASRAPRLAYALIAEPCEPEIDEARLEYRASLAAQFARGIEEGQRRGEFIDLPADVLSTCVTGAMMEPLVRPLSHWARISARESDRLAEDVATVCVRMVRKTELTSVKSKKGSS